MTLPTFAPFEAELDKFFDDALRTVTNQVWAPACNVYEDAERFWVEASIPGMESKDIEIMLEDRVLTIKGERKEEETKGRYLTREIPRGRFSRAFSLPEEVDESRVSASYQQGLLRVELPKREEAKPRRIAIG